MKKKLLTVFAITLLCAPTYAQSDNLLDFSANEIQISDTLPKNSAKTVFSLSTIMDNFLNYTNTGEFENLDEAQRQRANFLNASTKFNQGNIVVAYDDFSALCESINNDLALLNYAKSMFEIGFFSIGERALDKIKHKTYLQKQIEDLKISFLPQKKPDKNEEIFLAKSYVSAKFDNCAQEVSYELNKKEDFLNNSDWAQFRLAQIFDLAKQPKQALIFTDKALELNPKNVNYLLFKTKILIKEKDYKKAFEIIEEIEKSGQKSLALGGDFLILKETTLAGLAKNSSEAKYHLARKIFLEGNNKKALEESKNILTFDKNNSKTLCLLGFLQFIEGDYENAKNNYFKSYKLDKNNPETLVGIGDCYFIISDFENAQKFYTKAFAKNPKNQTSALKLALILKNENKTKELKKLEKKLAKMNTEPYFSYFLIAKTIAKENKNLKKEYLSKTMMINPLFENNWTEFLNLELENKRYDLAYNFLYTISFTNDSNYIYHYLCALYDITQGAHANAIVNLKNTLSLNPDFKDASDLLVKILPSKNDFYNTNTRAPTTFAPKIKPQLKEPIKPQENNVIFDENFSPLNQQVL